jgi:hypothetical protein
MLRSKWVRALVVMSLVGLALSLASATTAARPSPPNPPSLKLVSVLHHTNVVRYGKDNHLYLSPGVYLAATGGAFEIDAVRNPDGTITLWQMSRDSHGAHPLWQLTPPAPVRLGAGLPKFFHLVVRNSAGHAVVSKFVPFCLNDGYGLARVDASGADQPSYPFGCGDSLSRAAVWGIDQGWASGVNLSLPFSAPDGDYTLAIAITAPYARQLHIPAESATASVELTVSTETGGKCGVIRCPIAVAGQTAPDGTAPDGTAPDGTAQPQTEGPATSQDGSAGTNGLEQGDGVPDLQALPSHSLSVSHNRRNEHDYLNFGATIWNAGSGPLVIEGFRNGAAEVMPATQFIYRDGQPVSSSVVGQFEYDNRRGHHHWHMEDIAQYDLLDGDGNRVVLSGKQSFCLAPTDPIDLTLPGAEWQPDQASLWSACDGETAIWLREVLPAGWGDTYFQGVAGQSFNITGLANGQYQVRVTADPRHNLLETSYDNNVGLLSITLGGTPGHRTVKVG